MRREANGTARSRVDNSTPLCTVCEQTEAFEDLLGVLMPKEGWVFSQMCKQFGIKEVAP